MSNTVNMKTLKGLGAKFYDIADATYRKYHRIAIVEGTHDELIVWYNQAIEIDQDNPKLEVLQAEAQRVYESEGKGWLNGRYDFYQDYERILSTNWFGYRKHVDAAIAMHREYMADRAQAERLLEGPAVDDTLDVWSNQAFREAVVLARLEGRFLCVYHMPAGAAYIAEYEYIKGRTRMGDDDVRRWTGWAFKRSISAAKVPKYWRNAMGSEAQAQNILEDAAAGYMI